MSGKKEDKSITLDRIEESNDLSSMITRLSERNLASLYEQTQAPMRLHAALYSPDGLTEEGSAEIEAVLRENPPDLALISLGLCAVVLAEYLNRTGDDDLLDEHHSVITEMKYLGIESVEVFGPPYLGEDIGLIDIGELLELCPTQLAALGSLFEDIGDFYGFAATLSEIAYDQADRAEALLAGEPLPVTEAVTPSGDLSNVVPLDLFAAWRKEKEPAE